MLVSATSPFTPPPTEVVDIDYCYDVTISVTLPGADVGTSITVSACGDTPGEGLFNLGVAVRQA